MVLSVGIYAFRKGLVLRSTCGWSFFLIGALVYSLRLDWVLPAVPVTEYAIQVGTVIEVLFVACTRRSLSFVAF